MYVRTQTHTHTNTHTHMHTCLYMSITYSLTLKFLTHQLSNSHMYTMHYRSIDVYFAWTGMTLKNVENICLASNLYYINFIELHKANIKLINNVPRFYNIILIKSKYYNAYNIHANYHFCLIM